MGKINIGDLVGRKSYGMDLCFRVKDLRKEKGNVVAELKGVHYRLLADAPESDLEHFPEDRLIELEKNNNSQPAGMKVNGNKNPGKRRT